MGKKNVILGWSANVAPSWARAETKKARLEACSERPLHGIVRLRSFALSMSMQRYQNSTSGVARVALRNVPYKISDHTDVSFDVRYALNEDRA